MKKTLKITLIVDAIIAIGFGVYSWAFPHETYGTIILIPEMGSAAFLTILSSLSMFYILIGLTCLIGVKAIFPINLWIGILMAFRHLLEGLMKVFDIGKDWLIGNPYPDIIIHSFFVIIYILTLYFTYKSNRAANN